MASMVGLRAVTYAYSTVGYWLQRDANHQQLLRDALLASDDPLLEGWAERIRPPPQELLDLVQVRLPDMLAGDLLALPFAPVYMPAVTDCLSTAHARPAAGRPAALCAIIHGIANATGACARPHLARQGISPAALH